MKKNLSTTISSVVVVILAVGAAGCRSAPAVEAQLSAKSEVQPCQEQACASLVILQAGQPVRMDVSSQGIQAQQALSGPESEPEFARWVIDTGLPAPDGTWIAYTTVGNETGGPVVLHNLATGEWLDLITRINEHLPQSQAPYRHDFWWDVIGWFPDSERLMIGPSDLSVVLVVELTGFSSQAIPFPGAGRGGRLFVDLADDGQSFVYLGEDTNGNQVLASFDLASGETRQWLQLPYEQGVLYNPRLSPDQTQLVFVVQHNQPEGGMSYSLDLLAAEGGRLTELVPGNLGMTLPVWSPDGSQIAFTRSDDSDPLSLAARIAPAEEKQSLWVVSVADGVQTQLSFIDFSVRSPAWAADGSTLAFVGAEGQVLMTSTRQPGAVWQAAGPSEQPALTHVFFLP